MPRQAEYQAVAPENTDITDTRIDSIMSTTFAKAPQVGEEKTDRHGKTCNQCGKPRHLPHQSSNHAYTSTADIKSRDFDRSDTEASSAMSNFGKHGPQQPHHSSFMLFIRDWWLELISCFFLIGGLVAIIVTAHEYQDEPLPNLPQGLSINSIFAIYIVILKAAMLLILAQGLSHLKWTWFRKTRPLNDLARYDNASRGPLGSMWLLFVLRGRDLVASIGALLVIAAVILDPMAQQVLRYYNCPRSDSSTISTLPRTNAYMELGKHVAAGLSTIPVSLSSAINGGVYVPGSQVGVDCASGNCTFGETYRTVGFNFRCVDVSDELNFENVTVVQNTTMAQQDGNGNVVDVPIQNNYTTLLTTLPSGLNTSFNLFGSEASYMAMAYNQTLNSSVEVILGPQIVNPQDDHEPYCTGPSYANISDKSTNWLCRGWGAARCYFSPAIYTISSPTVKLNKLYEEVSLAITLDSNHAENVSASMSVLDATCLTAAQRTSLQQVGYNISTDTEWIPYKVALDLDGSLVGDFSSNITNSTRDIAPKECIYQVYGPTVNSIDSFFTTYFTGKIIPSGTEYDGPSVMQQFYNSQGMTFDSVSDMFNNISNSMTTYVRQNGLANNSAPALGQVWSNETCIRVRWPLVAYPAGLVIVTLLFFIAMVVETSRAQQGVHHDFKSSPLALLFHGLGDDAQQKLEKVHAGESNEVGDLSDQAKSMHVRLRPTERGWRFVNADSHFE